MKFYRALYGLSSVQTHTNELSIDSNIILRKAWNIEDLVIKKILRITYLNQSESGCMNL